MLWSLGGSTRLLAGSQADSFFAQGDCLNYSWNVPDDRQDTKIQPSFDVCYINKSVQGLIELLCRSWLLESSFLPHGIENSQLLQYDHAYQLSFCMNIKTMDMHACRDCTMELSVNFLLIAAWARNRFLKLPVSGHRLWKDGSVLTKAQLSGAPPCYRTRKGVGL